MKVISCIILSSFICCTTINKKTDTLNIGLIAYYPFNGNADDASGNNNNGIVHGAQLTTDRKHKQNSAYYFNGNLSYIDIGNSKSIKRYQKDFTVSSWIQLKSFCPSYNSIILSNRNQSTYPQSGSMIGIGGLKSSLAKQVEFIKNVSPTSDYFTYDYLGSNTLIQLNKWTHFAITYKYYNDSSNIATIYINGKHTATKKIGATINPLEINTYIGCEPSLTPVEYSLHADLDELRIYDRVLSNSEIKKLYSL